LPGGQLWGDTRPAAGGERALMGPTAHSPCGPQKRLSPHAGPSAETNERARGWKVGQRSARHSRTVRMSHHASATSAPTQATVITAPRAMPIGIQRGRPASAERFSGTAASRVEPRSTVSLGGIRPLPCGGLGQELKRTRPPKVTEIHRMGEGHRAASISSGGGGRSRPVSPPPQYRHVGPLRGNDGTSDPNRPQSTP
jgi:hypothetical protein